MDDERNELTHEHMRDLSMLLSGKSDEALTRMYYGAAKYIQNNITYLSPKDEAHLAHMGESAWPGVDVQRILGGVRSQSRPHRPPPREPADYPYRIPPRPPPRLRPSSRPRPSPRPRPDPYNVDAYPTPYPVDSYRPKKPKENPIPYIVVAVLVCAVFFIALCLYRHGKKKPLPQEQAQKKPLAPRPRYISMDPVDEVAYADQEANAQQDIVQILDVSELTDDAPPQA